MACLVVGAVIGGVGSASATFFILTRHYNSFINTQQFIMAMDQMNYLFHLKGGKGEALMTSIEERLPQWAADAHTLFQDEQLVKQFLWDVQHYYEKYEIAVPESVQPLLEGLPPRPLTCCQVRALEEQQNLLEIQTNP